MTCQDRTDELLDVLYGEAAPTVDARFRAHMAECPSCASEWRSLAGMRQSLTAWALPEIQSAGTARAAWAPPVWWWGLAAAALIALALAASVRLSGASASFERGPIKLSFGNAAEVSSLPPAIAAQTVRHEREIAALKAALASQTIASDDRMLLRRVSTMIRDSEARQLDVLGEAWDDYVTRTEARRRYDLARVSAGLSYVDRLNAERAAELASYVLENAGERR